jgi:hypothetical protein
MCWAKMAIDWRLFGDFGDYLAISPAADKEGRNHA